MFTGIVEELGHVRSITPIEGGARIEIDASTVLDDASLGASIAVNGCCLTVVDRGPGWWSADVQIESMRRTCLGKLRPGDPVNLERPMRVDGRLGGHLVQGHVEGVGAIRSRAAEADGSVRLRIDAPESVLRYVIARGSVTVDGVSLTVAEVHSDGFSVALIPHTLSVTTLGSKPDGAAVNLEPDLIAKYVERLLRVDERSN